MNENAAKVSLSEQNILQLVVLSVLSKIETASYDGDFEYHDGTYKYLVDTKIPVGIRGAVQSAFKGLMTTQVGWGEADMFFPVLDCNAVSIVLRSAQKGGEGA